MPRRDADLLRLRTVVLGLAKAAFLGLASAAPVAIRQVKDDEPEAEGGALWVLYVVSMALVLLGGAFAGLTIALMGQDEIYLQVIALDPEEKQRRNAKRVHDLLNKGKHWVLVTLLLSNVIVNETLPVVLDRCFGGGVAAVVGSTVLIVIFGEILPQSICVRYGLQIGGFMSKPVLLLMYLMAPVAWPTAKLLDWLLGEDHGTVYKKSGLKTLVTLHKSLGEVDERLNQDEVTIISAVLDLKRKPVEEVMTPMKDVFIMAEDTVLDEKTIDRILEEGYSRIPVHQTGNPTNFVGMLLVKILITYDPEDGKRVRDFALATLPETRPETSCLDIINFFQEGKSHMVLISESPGEDHGALGVVTLEDVIEELIGEEIIDESDVYVDVHKAIRRSQPAPKARIQRNHLMAKAMAAREGKLVDRGDGDNEQGPGPTRRNSSGSKSQSPFRSGSPKLATLMMRRSSAGHDGQLVQTTVPVKANIDEMREHLRHLGPSNPASNPKATRVSAVKIKPALGGGAGAANQPRANSFAAEPIVEDNEDTVDERTSLLRPTVKPKDGVQALHQSYTANPSDGRDNQLKISVDGSRDAQGQPRDDQDQPARSPAEDKLSPTASASTDSLGRRRGNVRSGSITENVVEAGGVRKVVLEANSSSETEEAVQSSGPAKTGDANGTSSGSQQASGGSTRRKKKNKKKKGGKSGH
ncbi:hypothetical protein F4780DRAFT_268918 [Xylariomycetidae sp. FL0641]|nr:hypothetical protein F4780DRAFT_268918 [Xylariomycetidae sp. FL0641]